MDFWVDIWEEGLRFLQSRLKPGQAIELICRSAEELELPRGSLDKIFCFETLHDLSHLGEALPKVGGSSQGGRASLLQGPRDISRTARTTFQENR